MLVAGLLALALIAGPAPVADAGQAAAAPPAAAHPAPAQPAPVEAPAAAHNPAPAPAAAEHSAGQPAPAAGQEPAAGHAVEAGHESAEAHAESPWGLVARIFNFAVLVGLLVYFLRSPIVQHLATRRQQIAGDLVQARETTARARQQLTDIDRRLKELPAELELLRADGAEEIAAEGARIRQQAEAERHRLLEQTRRDIELQVRLARQALSDHAADLAVRMAKDRLAETITPADQDRLVDRYVSHVKELHG